MMQSVYAVPCFEQMFFQKEVNAMAALLFFFTLAKTKVGFAPEKKAVRGTGGKKEWREQVVSHPMFGTPTSSLQCL
jgi:hypothetical protein